MRKLSFTKMAESKRFGTGGREGCSLNLEWQKSKAGLYLYIYWRELRQKSSHSFLNYGHFSFTLLSSAHASFLKVKC
jgi:hypothetical protein